MTAFDTVELQAEAARIRSAVAQIAQLFHVFPIDNPMVPYCDGVKTREHDPHTCTERGKHPTCRWSMWSTQDPGKLCATQYFGGNRPHNIGIDCGKSRILVVDEDAKGEWDRFCRDLEFLVPVTFTVNTAKGRHIYFRQPAGLELGNQEGALRGYKLNVRGIGGYVVGPGSLHETWVHYKIAKPLVDPIDVPDWLIRALSGQRLSSNGLTDPAPPPKDNDWWRTGPIAAGNRHAAIVAAAGWCHRMGLSLNEAKPTVRDVWSRCTGDKYTEDQAYARLDDVYGRYPAGDRLGERRGDTGEIPAITVVTLEEFAAVDEPGAEPLLGEGDDALIPTSGDVMFYGDGGAGKTTMCVDLACHFGAGDNWLGITVPRPLTVLVVENEGPRALFRKKLARKKAAWAGSPLGGRVRVVESPWASLSFAEETHRDVLAKTIAEHGCDVVLIGPVSKSGMTEAGTLAEVRGFTTLVAEVRHRSGRPVTFVLVHHENRAGTPSGAWEGAVDTLLHVTGMGHGHTRLHIQKARWSSTWHAQTLKLSWADGDSYTVDVEPELSDDDIAEQILAAIEADPGTSWTRVEKMTPGIRRDKRRTVRDRLFADGVIVNIVKEDGHDVALDHCPERRPAHLYPTSDPTISHLRPTPGAGGAQTAPPTDGTPTASAPLRPDLKEGAGRGAVAGEPSALFDTRIGT